MIMDCSPPGSFCAWDSPGKNTGVGCCALFWGIFLTQELNPCLLCLLHCRQILYPLSHWGSLSYTSIYKATCILKPLKNTDAEDFPGGPVVKNPPANEGVVGSIPSPGRVHMPSAIKPTCHNYGSPHDLQPTLRKKRSHCKDKPVHCN